MKNDKAAGRTTGQHSAPGGRSRISAVVAMVVSVLVMLVTVLMMAPAGTPLKREVQSVAAPFFTQSWKVFAPNIMKANFTFEIRAQWRNDTDELVRSDWVSITDIEIAQVHGNIAPSRVQKSSWNASQSYQKRFAALTTEQKERVQDTFIRKTTDGFQAISDAELLTELGEDDANAIRFLRMDYMMLRYATLYATAGFGEDIERVQWRVVRDRPNDITHRFDDEQQYEPRITTYGWRQPNVAILPDVVAEYRAVIDRMDADWIFRKAAEHAK